MIARQFSFLGALLWTVGCHAAHRPMLPICCDNKNSSNRERYTSATHPRYLPFGECNEKKYPSSFGPWSYIYGNLFKYRYSSIPSRCRAFSLIRKSEFRIADDVSLVVRGALDYRRVNPPPSTYTSDNYCLIYVNGDIFAYICEPKFRRMEEKQNLSWPQKYCSVVSAVILIVTYAAYLANRSVEKDNQNEPYLICHSLSLAAAFICLSRVKLFRIIYQDWECMIGGYFLQYFSLVAFFWMNASYINIYMTISRMRHHSSSSRAHENLRWNEFKKFSAYAWGVPLIITVTTLILQNFDIISDSKLRPDIGMKSCFFDSLTVSWIYFYGPIGLVIFINTILFILTVNIVYKHHKVTKRLCKNDNSKRDLWYIKPVILKLFIYTGSFLWGSEVLNFIVLTNPDAPESHRQIVGMIDVSFHLLHAVSIFYFLVYQKGVHRNLLMCYPALSKLGARIRYTVTVASITEEVGTTDVTLSRTSKFYDESNEELAMVSVGDKRSEIPA